MQCPPDFVGVSAVAGLGSVIGRQVGIRPQAHTDWTVIANEWGLIVGRPGVMKSPAMNEALAPLRRLEAKAREENQAALSAYKKSLAEYRLRQKAAKSAAQQKLKGSPNADLSDLLPGEEPEEPQARRFIASDCTYEALGDILANNPNGVLAFRDEMVALLRTLDREEYAAARGFFLTGWNGTDGYTFDRIIRGHLHIEGVCISMLGSTQPGRLAEYIGRARQGGAGDDGLIQRFGLMVWPDQPSEWRNVDRTPDYDARQIANTTFERLSALSLLGTSAEPDPYGRGYFLRFDQPALEEFTAWREALEHRLRAGDLHPALESHLSKYRKLVPGLALINHLADFGAGPVSQTATSRALKFADYLESHARRAYAAGLHNDVAPAKAILDRIRKGDLTDGFTARDIYQRDWSNLSDHKQVQAGLNLLVDLDWLSDEELKTGGRPKVIYHINPLTLR
ncbi:YfjI family protein [Microvirga massiliensis]|uniref:YfjI family protein n=1 Tax=Microvirga massiliensis TaxID=1033741 RepID=UPI0007C78BAB|nr:YfjI family protein [Microvirga massiliensis]